MRAFVVAGLLLVAAPASADIFQLSGEIDAGGMLGKGTTGAQADNAFFAKSPNAAYGAIVTGEVFGFLDAIIQHDEFTDFSRITTWTQFGAGLHFEFPFGDDLQQRVHKGPFLEAAAAVFFGIGTGQEVMPPLDNAQITDKAFIAEGKLGLGYHCSHVVDVGISVPVSWGYFFKNGPGVGANDTSNQYQGVQGEVFGYVRFNIHLL
jgi:hypothetical protein